VWVAPAGGGEARCLTVELDRTAEDAMLTDTAAASDPGLVWSGDGQHLYFQVSDQGNTHLYRVGADGGDAECVVGGRRRVHDFSLSRDGQRVAFVAADPLNPGDVYVCAADGADERRLTRVNEGYLRSVALSEPEEFWVESQAEDRLPIQAWLLRPAGFEEGRKYPVVLEVHGGPHSMYGNVFFHEFQLLAAQGYAVVYANPRGSQGYGDAFTKAAVGAWGERDMPDLMAVLDHVVGMGFVDANRQAVLGGSYGGFMTNWLVGHTDRFRAAITMRCVSNLYSFYGTSDIGFRFGEYEIGGMPWENRDQYLRLSPISYVERMTTPLLILHSEADYRCPIEQAEQLFVMLKRLGREVEFVRFPDESHGLSRNGKPKHRVERLQHILRWFERYL
ncbi:MAG: S9 family peptidase, partial [Thermomicrobiaceae bacterium]|nr:S9 family peptidase [Thermomicrobiaceae bacterium]